MFAHHHRQHHPHRSSSPAMHYQLQYPHHQHPVRSPVSSINGLRSSSPGTAFYVDLNAEHDRELGQYHADHALTRAGPAGCGVEAMHYHPHHGHGHGYAHSHEHEHPSQNILGHPTSAPNIALQDRLEAYARLDAQRRQEELEALQAQQQRRRAQEERTIRAKIQAQLEEEAQRQREAEAEAEAEVTRRAMRFAAMQKERAEAQARIRAAQLQAQAQARAEAEARRRAEIEYEQEKQQRVESERKKSFFAHLMHQSHEQSVAAQEKHEAEQRKFIEHVQAQAVKRKLAIERMEREEEARQQEQEKLKQKQVHFEQTNKSDNASAATKVNIKASPESQASKSEQEEEDQHIKPEELVKFLLAQFGILPPRQSPTSASSANATAPASKPTPSPVAAENKKGKGRATSPAHSPAAASKPRQQEQEPEHDVAKSLAALEDIKNHFQGLSASFEEPETLVFEAPAAPIASTSNTVDSDSTAPTIPALAFTASNRPLKNYEESLTRLLTELDEVQSFGLQTIKDSRKALAVQVQQELERVDAIKVKHWETQQAQAGESVQVEDAAAKTVEEASQPFEPAQEVAGDAAESERETTINQEIDSVSHDTNNEAREEDYIVTVEKPVSAEAAEAPENTESKGASSTQTLDVQQQVDAQASVIIDTTVVQSEDAAAGQSEDAAEEKTGGAAEALASDNAEEQESVEPITTEEISLQQLQSTSTLTEHIEYTKEAEHEGGSAAVEDLASPAGIDAAIESKSDAGSETSSVKSGQRSPKATTVSDADEDENAEVHSETSFEWIE